MINTLEAIMIFCWGLSWPVSIHKSYVSRTAKGKSLVYEIFTWVGYVCGITRKAIIVSSGVPQDWVFYLGYIFYFINITAVTIDMALWIRNHRLDMEKAQTENF